MSRVQPRKPAGSPRGGQWDEFVGSTASSIVKAGIAAVPSSDVGEGEQRTFETSSGIERTATVSATLQCPSCQRFFETPDDLAPLYECSRCGGTSTERRCSECNIFAARADDDGCEDCGEPAEEVETITCPGCDTLMVAEDADGHACTSAEIANQAAAREASAEKQRNDVDRIIADRYARQAAALQRFEGHFGPHIATIPVDEVAVGEHALIRVDNYTDEITFGVAPITRAGWPGGATRSLSSDWISGTFTGDVEVVPPIGRLRAVGR